MSFPAGALEARDRRTSTTGTSGENRVMYGGLYQNTRVVCIYYTPNLKYPLITVL